MNLIALHAIIGVATIAIGIASLRVRKFSSSHSYLGESYHWLMLLTCISALIISFLRGRATVFTYLAPFSYAFALTGYLMAKYRPKNWLQWHISMQCGSFIALITATLFQFVFRIFHSDIMFLGFPIIFWITLLLPTLIGRFFVVRVRRRWAKVNLDKLNRKNSSKDNRTITANA